MKTAMKHTQDTENQPAISPNFMCSAYTIACERHPERNEDSILVDRKSGIFGIFDGVGGSAAGEVASRIAAATILHAWRKKLLHETTEGQRKTLSITGNSQKWIEKTLQDILLAADKTVRIKGSEKAGTDDLATTAAVGVLHFDPKKDRYKFTFAHVGDSRIYIIRKNTKLERLTEDDGLLARLIESQQVTSEQAHTIDQAMSMDELNEEELGYFKMRGGITQALGSPITPAIHIGSTDFHSSDSILLCSDGIHDNLSDTEILALVGKHVSYRSAKKLVEYALSRSQASFEDIIRAKPDDMSAILISMK